MNRKPNIYDLLDPIMNRPIVYIKADSLSELEKFINGFEMGFQLAIREVSNPPIATTLMFKEWINENVNIDLCESVYEYLRATSHGENEAIERFCQIYKEFRGDQFCKHRQGKA